MYEGEFFRQPVPSVQPRFCFISRCCLIFMYDQEYLNNFIFFWQCECDVEYNNIFFHIVGYYMNYTSEYIRAQLAKYITKYMDAVRVVAGDFLKAKGLTVEDYLLHISQPGNRADELAVYLVSRFCQKYIGTITKGTVWFIRQDTSIEDCLIVLVYLGGGTFCDTKPKVGKCFRQLPTPMECEEPDSDFVYDLGSPWGSPVPCRHTRSMGTPPRQLSPSGAESSTESSEPDAPKPKSRRPRRPKRIVVKGKVYKIR